MSFEVEILPRHPEKIYRNVTCDGCGFALKNMGPIRDDPNEWEHLMPDDALILRLDGGYGMAIDPYGNTSQDELTKLLCGDCTRKLCEQWPAIAKTVQAHCSSTLGHYCSKERKFVWKKLSNCCSF